MQGFFFGEAAMQVDVRDNISDVLRRMDSYKRDVVDKAIPRALNRVGDMTVTAASREMRADGYNFTASEIKAACTVWKASTNRLVTTVKVRRKTKSLVEFGARESKAGVTVKVHGSKKLIKGAFLAQRQNGLQGVFIEDKAAGKIILRMAKHYKKGGRGGWHSLPAKKLYGPSVGGAYANAKIQDIMMRLIAENFEDRLVHEIKYLSR